MDERRVPMGGEGPWWIDRRRWVGEYKRTQVPGTILWDEHLEIWRAYAQRYSGQDAEKIAQRGGFGYWEATDLIGYEPKTWKPR